MHKVKYMKKDKCILIDVYSTVKDKVHLVIGPLFDGFDIRTLKMVKKNSSVSIECEKTDNKEKWPRLFENQAEQPVCAGDRREASERKEARAIFGKEETRIKQNTPQKSIQESSRVSLRKSTSGGKSRWM